MGNIFVSESNPGKMTGFIDWQNTSVYPLFMQARFPVFLTPPEGYQERTVMTDDEGWIAPERDFDEMQIRNQMLLEYYMSKQGTTSPDELKRMWPFPPRQ